MYIVTHTLYYIHNLKTHSSCNCKTKLNKTFLPYPRTGLLFHRAILMSGSGLAPWSLVSDPAYYAAIVSNHVNCSPDLPYSHLMKCLRERPLEALLSTPIRPPDFGNAFGPSVDGVVIGNLIHWRYSLEPFNYPLISCVERTKFIILTQQSCCSLVCARCYHQTRTKLCSPIPVITITVCPHRKYQIIIR